MGPGGDSVTQCKPGQVPGQVRLLGESGSTGPAKGRDQLKVMTSAVKKMALRSGIMEGWGPLGKAFLQCRDWGGDSRVGGEGEGVPGGRKAPAGKMCEDVKAQQADCIHEALAVH